MRLGIVDLDTSHPENWIPIERELGHEIVGIWDGGSIHPFEYVVDFAKKMNIPKVYDNLEDMVSDVDCAIIHGCDWDTHIKKTLPFAKNAKSILLDKPIAGNLYDLQQFSEWQKQGIRIFGGSSLRFCYEVQDFFSKPLTERGTPHTVFCGCAVDEFNYGIHAYSLLSGILGRGIKSVRHLGKKVQRRIQINWHDGKIGLLTIGEAAKWHPFYASIVTEKNCFQFQPDCNNLYRAFLEITLPYLAGQVEKPPIPLNELIEPELAALAAKLSWEQNDREVNLSELTENIKYDGEIFAKKYKSSKYSSN